MIYLFIFNQESAKSAAEVARKHFANVESVWGDNGLEQIIKDDSILGVAVVLAGQAQVLISISKRNSLVVINFV